MSTEKKNNQSPDKKQYDPKTDQAKHDQRYNEGEDDADTERDPEEQVTKPREYRKDDQKYNDKSERA